KLSSVSAKLGSPVLLKVTLSLLVGANPVPVQLPALLHRVSPPSPDHTTSARANWALSTATAAADNIKAFFRFVRTEVSLSDPGFAGSVDYTIPTSEASTA